MDRVRSGHRKPQALLGTSLEGKGLTTLGANSSSMLLGGSRSRQIAGRMGPIETSHTKPTLQKAPFTSNIYSVGANAQSINISKSLEGGENRDIISSLKKKDSKNREII